ncbi:hypothetical protein C8J57DRAFT_1227841 [Mycena rebaudengoi]|nr:hypothetical protein C8J57DRAFT_1227841 [Mycena rebaudengoi]
MPSTHASPSVRHSPARVRGGGRIGVVSAELFSSGRAVLGRSGGAATAVGGRPILARLNWDFGSMDPHIWATDSGLLDLAGARGKGLFSGVGGGCEEFMRIQAFKSVNNEIICSLTAGPRFIQLRKCLAQRCTDHRDSRSSDGYSDGSAPSTDGHWYQADTRHAHLCAIYQQLIMASTQMPNILSFHPGLTTSVDHAVPAMNTLANHGYVSRDGITTFEEIILAGVEAFNIDRDTIANMAAVNMFTSVLKAVEGDASLTCSDAFIGDNCNFNQTLWDMDLVQLEMHKLLIRPKTPHFENRVPAGNPLTVHADCRKGKAMGLNETSGGNKTKENWELRKQNKNQSESKSALISFVLEQVSESRLNGHTIPFRSALVIEHKYKHLDVGLETNHLGSGSKGEMIRSLEGGCIPEMPECRRKLNHCSLIEDSRDGKVLWCCDRDDIEIRLSLSINCGPGVVDRWRGRDVRKWTLPGGPSTFQIISKCGMFLTPGAGSAIALRSQATTRANAIADWTIQLVNATGSSITDRLVAERVEIFG